MTPLLGAIGVAAIALGLLDVFFTVLVYDAYGLVVESGYRVMWHAVRWLARWLPARASGAVITLAAPVMVVASILTWMALQVAGFAALYYPGVRDGGIEVNGLPRNVLTAVYFSASTITSLSFGRPLPGEPGYYFLTAAETFTGFAILTVSVTYVLGLYSVVERAGTAWMTMQDHMLILTGQATRTGVPAEYLGGEGQHLPALWRDSHTALVEYMEGMRRYPMAYYFHTRRRRRSLPSMFALTGETAAAVRWGLPAGHPAARDPWLLALLEAYRRSVLEIRKRFLRGARTPGALTPVPLEQFLPDWRARRSADAGLQEFLEVTKAMSPLAGPAAAEPGDLAYQRYRDWLTFTVHARAFVGSLSSDFQASAGHGIDPDDGDALAAALTGSS